MRYRLLVVLVSFILGILGLVGTAAAQTTTFTVSNSGMTAYVINGSPNPVLTLTRGTTYTFTLNSPGHPFFIKTAQVTGTGSTFDTGVTNNGATAGTLTFAVPATAPATLFYQCSLHTPMTNRIAIVDPDPALTNVSFRQLDWQDDKGISFAPNSVWGMVFFSYTPDPSQTFYVNVVLSTASGPADWMIQNLPLFPAIPGGPARQGQGADLNLAELGLASGNPVGSLGPITYVLTATTAPLTSMPSSPVLSASFTPLVRNAWNEAVPSSPADRGQPTPVRIPGAAQRVGQGRVVKEVQEGSLKCFAGSTARSLDWLNRSYALGFPDGGQQIYTDLLDAGVSFLDPEDAASGFPFQALRLSARWIARKDSYARSKSGNRIQTKVWDRGSMLSPICGIARSVEDFKAVG